MQKWDYLKIETSRELKGKYLKYQYTDWDANVDLAKLGEAGWELVSVVPIAQYFGEASGSTEQLIYYFKRPKE